MNRFIFLTAVALLALLLAGTQSIDAAKTELRVTPANLKDVDGLTVDAEPREGGTRVRFTIRRNPAKARWQLRTGDLTVDTGAALVECPVHGRKRAGGVIEYRFTLSADAVDDAEFVLREVQGSEEDEIQLIGGGEFYSMRLSDFAPKSNPKG